MTWHYALPFIFSLREFIRRYYGDLNTILEGVETMTGIAGLLLIAAGALLFTDWLRNR